MVGALSPIRAVARNSADESLQRASGATLERQVSVPLRILLRTATFLHGRSPLLRFECLSLGAYRIPSEGRPSHSISETGPYRHQRYRYHQITLPSIAFLGLLMRGRT